MSIQNILQQLLQSAQNMGQTSTLSTKDLSAKATSALGGFTGGALTGGALGLLLGNKKFRKIGGKVAAYGGVAALGVVAYNAYNEWQKKEKTLNDTTPPAVALSPNQPPTTDLEDQSRLILAAMISAAKSDGHINEEEQALLDVELQKLASSEHEQQWLSAQLAGPADPTAIARLASTPEQGAEIYLASVLITNADSFMERAYLDELARQLNIESSLKEHLEKTVLG